MGIQNWSENIILLNLAAEPQLGEELQAVIEMVTAEKPRDVVIDFAEVEILTSSSIAKLPCPICSNSSKPQPSTQTQNVVSPTFLICSQILASARP